MAIDLHINEETEFKFLIVHLLLYYEKSTAKCPRPLVDSDKWFQHAIFQTLPFFFAFLHKPLYVNFPIKSYLVFANMCLR